MVLTASIDDIFRQKSLPEIHTLLKQTRSDVETKKQDIRELVGDHYRSVLESSDHIRAMSDCAARISSSSQKLEELLASMQTLARQLPPTTTTTTTTTRSASAAVVLKGSAGATPCDDRNYRLGLRVMDLLEIPDTVRGHLADLEFLQATRLALIESSTIQSEVDALLVEGEAGQQQDFDILSLAQQQVQALRSLPLQISSSCLDAFSSARLEVTSGVQSFVIRLLLDQTAQPLDLLRTFINKRSGLLSGLGRAPRRAAAAAVGGDASTTAAAAADLAAVCGARLAAGAIAFEGSIVVACALAPGATHSVGKGAVLPHALEVVEQALSGQRQSQNLTTRIQGLRNKLLDVHGAEEMAAELARLGQKLVRDWAAGPSPKIAELLARIVEQAAPSDAKGCQILGQVLSVANEKVFAYRRAICSQLGDADWEMVWKQSCKRFCGAGPCPSDAASLVSMVIDRASAEVAKERVSGLNLDLECSASSTSSSTGDEDGVGAGFSVSGRPGGPTEDSEQQFCEAIREFRTSTLHRVQTFDHHLGEIVSDSEVASGSSSLPLRVASALVESVSSIVSKAAGEVHFPAVSPIWPSTGSTAPPPRSTLRQTARAAIALEVLTSLAEAPPNISASTPEATTKLQQLLKVATSSGDSQLGSKAQELLDTLRRHSDMAFLAWARCALSIEASPTRETFWNLTEEEVLAVCSWGTAAFSSGKAASVGVGSTGNKEERAVSVPLQASPYVFERLALATRRLRQVSAGGLASAGLIAATKAALTESFLCAFDPETKAIQSRKKTCMNQLLQWLFDLHILRLVLSSSHPTEAASKETYNELRTLQDKAEAEILSDPVDRLLYQPVMKTGVRNQIQSVKLVWAPFFTDNSLYSFQFKGQGDSASGMAETPSSSTFSALRAATSASELAAGDGFQLQPSKQQPFRQVQSRFPLLPVAMGASAMGSPTASDSQRGSSYPSTSPMGFGTAPGVNPDRAVAAAAAAASSLAQQVGSGLGSLGFSKAFNPIGNSWATTALQGWSGATGTGLGASKAPENV